MLVSITFMLVVLANIGISISVNANANANNCSSKHAITSIDYVNVPIDVSISISNHDIIDISIPAGRTNRPV